MTFSIMTFLIYDISLLTLILKIIYNQTYELPNRAQPIDGISEQNPI